MANISVYLQKILDAVYGEEVRGSIHQALTAMNVESAEAMRFASAEKDSAKASADAARTSASTATQKADAAAASAQAARTSETNANASKIAAEAARVAAANIQNEVQAAGTAAETAKTAAQAAQSAAEKAKMSAQTAQAAAETARDSAQTSATTAGTAASTAIQKANAASASAQAARTSELNADASKTAAETARTAVANMQNEVQAAKNDAESAQDAAQLAQSAAEAALDSATSKADSATQSAAEAAEAALSAMQYSGKPPKPQDGTWWIWDAEQQKYINSGIRCELVGPAGNGIKTIQLTSGTHAPGTTDIYTVTMTDDTTLDISVYNGRNGTGTGNVLGVTFDLLIPASGWHNDEITVSDSRLLALSTNKYFLCADEASHEEFLACNVQPKDISATGYITFTTSSVPTSDLTVNIIRLELAANST